jgi:hypothetical protein
MKTLILKRKYKGYYQNRVGSIVITVSDYGTENGGKSSWQGTVIDESAKNDKDYLLYNTFGETKAEVVSNITKNIVKILNKTF